MLFSLLKPGFYGLKNRLRANYTLRGTLGRDIVILLFSIGILIAIYRGTLGALYSIQGITKLAYLHASLPLGLILSLLFVMLTFSNAVAAIGAFFQGRDLDLLLSAPISPLKFFCGRFASTLIGSSWMVLVFVAPVVIAFGQAYHGDLYYYLMSVAVLTPYFVTATALSVVIVITLSRLIPVSSTRHVLLFICLLALGSVYYALRFFTRDNSGLGDINDALQIVSYFTRAQQPFLPSYWAATSLGQWLEPSGRQVAPGLTLLYAGSVALIAFAYLGMLAFHHHAYSRARNARQTLMVNSRTAQRLIGRIAFFIDRQYRAIIVKEFRSFSRDMTQAIQLLLLLGLCLIYLYNFKLLHSVQNLPESVRVWWQGFLVFSSVGMGAFAVTAICSRFVFPSVSLEGQSFWIIQSSPLPISHFLWARFWCWFCPVSILSAFLFASGAVAIGAPRNIVIVNVATSFVICYGITGLAVGVGAAFSNFTWDSAYQLSASMGNLVFMILSALLIFISLAPVGALIFLRTVSNTGHEFGYLQWYGAVGSSTLFLVVCNYLATRWAIRIGERNLHSLLD